MKPIIEETQILIQAPIDEVWQKLNRFEQWPQWSGFIKEVRAVPHGWQFRARNIQLVDQLWVIEPIANNKAKTLEWDFSQQFEHNLITRGKVELIPTPFGTKLAAHIELEPDYPSRLFNFLADTWSIAFSEPGKVLNGMWYEFKAFVEGQTSYPTQLKPLFPIQPAA